MCVIGKVKSKPGYIVNKEGNTVKLFNGDSFTMSPVKCNINGVKKIENEIILYKNGNTNIGIEDIQDFNTYLTPKNRIVYYKTFDDKIHSKIYNLGNEEIFIYSNSLCCPLFDGGM